METIYFLTIPLMVSGYFFGKWTCGLEIRKNKGFLITACIFTLLNIIHSIIDGTILGLNLSIFSKTAGIIVHEIIRQPLLYIFFFSAILPFNKKWGEKIFWGIISITVTSLIGTIVGILIGKSLEIPHEYGEVINLFVYAFFAGDIIHHIIDYYHK
jgi:hypothetical protein